MKWLSLIAQQLAKRLVGLVFAGLIAFGTLNFLEVAPREIEVLAVIVAVLFIHRLSPAFAALMGHNHVVVDAVAAAAQVGVAFIAGIAPARKMRPFPFPSAVEAMPCHATSLKVCADQSKHCQRPDLTPNRFLPTENQYYRTIIIPIESWTDRMFLLRSTWPSTFGSFIFESTLGKDSRNELTYEPFIA